MKTAPAALAFLLVASTALAQVEGSIEVGVRYRVGTGESPAIFLTATRDLRDVSVTLVPVDGERRTFPVGNLRKGSRHTVTWEQAPGRAYYNAEIRHAGLATPDEITFSIAVARTFDLNVRGDEVDLAEGRIGFDTSGEVSRIELILLGEEGRILDRREYRMDLVTTRPDDFRFPPPADPVMQVRLTAYDAENFTRTVEFSPVVIEVPHDEVAFEFDRSDIRPGEEPKLHRTLQAAHEALGKLGDQYRLRLYVAGYTDTVGTNEYNRKLSEARAASIARWLKAQGLRVPVCSQGFGEDVLAVQTPDETPEPRNRRSLFVLAGQSPSSRSFPRGDWNCH